MTFANQCPAYAANIAGETSKALDALRNDPLHRARYSGFLADMVYGERAEFGEELETVTAMILDVARILSCRKASTASSQLTLGGASSRTIITDRGPRPNMCLPSRRAIPPSRKHVAPGQ